MTFSVEWRNIYYKYNFTSYNDILLRIVRPDKKRQTEKQSIITFA